MSQITKKNITEALKQIIEPNTGENIVSLQIVNDIQLTDGKAIIELRMNKEHPASTSLQRKIEEVLVALDGVTTVKVKTINKQDDAQQTQLNGLSRVKKIIAVSSCKGGVGKSTVSALIAYHLAKKGLKVGLIDADLHGPSIPLLFQLKNVQVNANQNNQLIPIEKDGLKLMSFGFLLGDGPAVMRGPIASRYIQEILSNTNWGTLDYLFIDMPPGTGDVQLTITQSLKLDGAIIVTTPQTLSLVDVARGILMFEKVSVPILGVIENLAYFMCDNCEKKHFIFGQHTDNYFKNQLGTSVLARLPIVEHLSDLEQVFQSSKEVDHLVNQIEKTINMVNKSETLTPNVDFDENYVYIIVNPEDKLRIPNRMLRLNCPCALCRDEMTGKRIFTERDLKEGIAAKSITPIGNYGIGIAWNDGHETGIFPYALLNELSKREGVT